MLAKEVCGLIPFDFPSFGLRAFVPTCRLLGLPYAATSFGGGTRRRVGS